MKNLSISFQARATWIAFTIVLVMIGCNRENQKHRSTVEVFIPAAEEANNKALQLYKEGRFAEAIKEIDEAIRLHPMNSVYHFNRAKSKCGIKDWDGAIEDLSKAIEEDP